MTWIFIGWMLVSRLLSQDVDPTVTEPTADWTLDGTGGQPPQAMDGTGGQPPQKADGTGGQPPSRW